MKKLIAGIAVMIAVLGFVGTKEAKADGDTLHGVADIIDAIGGRDRVYVYDDYPYDRYYYHRPYYHRSYYYHSPRYRHHRYYHCY